MWFPEIQRCSLQVWTRTISSLKFFKKILLRIYLLENLTIYAFNQGINKEYWASAMHRRNSPCWGSAVDKPDKSPCPQWNCVWVATTCDNKISKKTLECLRRWYVPWVEQAGTRIRERQGEMGCNLNNVVRYCLSRHILGSFTFDPFPFSIVVVSPSTSKE